MYNAPIQHYNVFWCERWKGTMWEVNIFARFDYNQRKLSICHVILVPFLVSIMDAVHTHNGARKRTNVSVCLKLFFSFLFLILLHEYCYLILTAFVVLTQTNTWLYNRPSCNHKLYLASISAYAECFYNIMRKYIKNTCNFDKFPTPILCYPL